MNNTCYSSEILMAGLNGRVYTFLDGMSDRVRSYVFYVIDSSTRYLGMAGSITGDFFRWGG